MCARKQTFVPGCLFKLTKPIRIFMGKGSLVIEECGFLQRPLTSTNNPGKFFVLVTPALYAPFDNKNLDIASVSILQCLNFGLHFPPSPTLRNPNLLYNNQGTVEIPLSTQQNGLNVIQHATTSELKNWNILDAATGEPFLLDVAINRATKAFPGLAALGMAKAGRQQDLNFASEADASNLYEQFPSQFGFHKVDTAVQLPVRPPLAEPPGPPYQKSPVEHIPIYGPRQTFVRQVAFHDPPVSENFEPEQALAAPSVLKTDSDYTAHNTSAVSNQQSDKIRKAVDQNFFGHGRAQQDRRWSTHTWLVSPSPGRLL